MLKLEQRNPLVTLHKIHQVYYETKTKQTGMLSLTKEESVKLFNVYTDDERFFFARGLELFGDLDA